MNTEVDNAVAKLWEYINSLPPERRAEAIAYQQKLEAAAAVTDGGMQTVIRQELAHHNMLLVETLDELREVASGHVANMAIRGIMNRDN